MRATVNALRERVMDDPNAGNPLAPLLTRHERIPVSRACAAHIMGGSRALREDTEGWLAHSLCALWEHVCADSEAVLVARVMMLTLVPVIQRGVGCSARTCVAAAVSLAHKFTRTHANEVTLVVARAFSQDVANVSACERRMLVRMFHADSPGSGETMRDAGTDGAQREALAALVLRETYAYAQRCAAERNDGPNRDNSVCAIAHAVRAANTR